MTKEKKNKLIIYIIIVIISSLMCIGYITGHYATDSFNVMDNGYHYYSIHNNLIEGRPIMFLIDHLYNLFHISYDFFFFYNLVIAILLTSLNIMLLYQLIEKYIDKKKYYYVYIILFSTIFNFMYIENLYCVESNTMALTLVMYTLAAKAFFNNSKNHYLKSLLYVIIAILGYNGLECYYIVLIGFLSLLKNKKVNKDVILDILKAGAMIISSVVINLIQIRISGYFLNLKDDRSIRIQGAFNIIYLIYMTPEILVQTSYLFPKYAYLLTIIGIIITSIVIEKKTKNNNLSFSNLFLILISISSCFCIGLISISSFGTGRLLYGIGMSVGLSLLFLFIKINSKDIIFKKIIIILIMIWSIVNFSNNMYRIMQSKNNNIIEKKEILNLNQKMTRYETENNKKITKIICVHSNQMRQANDIDASALKTEWSSAGVINYYTGRKIKPIEIEKQKDYIKKMNGKAYTIEDDTLFVTVYYW